MKDIKIILLIVCLLVLLEPTRAIYYPKKIILVDKNIDISNFP